MVEAAAALVGASISDDVTVLFCGVLADFSIVTVGWNSNVVTAGHVLYLTANRPDPAGFHGGKFNSTTYRLVMSGAGYGFLCSTNTVASEIVIDGLQFEKTTQGWAGGPGTGLADVTMKNCIWKIGDGVSEGLSISNYGAKKVRVVNCVCVSNGVVWAWGSYFNTEYVNCVAVGGAIGYKILYGASTGVTALNCISFNNGADFGALATIDHCASDDGDGTSPVTVASWAAQFLNPNYIAELDFRIKPSCTLSNAGIGPASDALVPTTSMGSAYRYGTTTDVGPFNRTSFKQKSSAQGLSSQGAR
jgi:hypothetical protein